MTTVREVIEPLDGALVHLRPATDDVDDRGTFGTILADPTVGQWWQVPDIEADVDDLLGDPELAIWLIEEAGSIVGVVMAGEETDPQYRHGSIDIALAAGGQGRGLGRDTVRTVARWLIDVRGHHRLIIDPSAANERAIRTYASVGFRPVGTLREYERWRDGSWHDGLLMELLSGELVGQ